MKEHFCTEKDAMGMRGLTRISLLSLFVLSACASPQTKEAVATVPEASAQTFAFKCSDNYEFVARTTDEAAWLFLESGTIYLPRSGTDVYSNARLHFQTNGQEASLDIPGGGSLLCQNDRRQAIWEHAKLNGADYRAVGNEPGWHLEVQNQAHIILVTDYGLTRLEFRSPPPEIDKTNRVTRYQTRNSDHELTLIISAEPCLDSMSGEDFSSKAIVILDGKTLQGCGRALH